MKVASSVLFAFAVGTLSANADLTLRRRLANSDEPDQKSVFLGFNNGPLLTPPSRAPRANAPTPDPVPVTASTVKGTTPFTDQEYVVVQFSDNSLNLTSTVVQDAIDDAFVNAYTAINTCVQIGASCEM